MDFSAHPAALIAQTLGWLALAALGWETVRRECGPRWRWWLLAGVMGLAFRWPLLWVPHQFNPDESQLIAGAITLTHDPMFWRSVDGGTAGPLDFFPLLPAAWADGTTSYAIARAIQLAVVFSAFFFAGETLRLIAGPAVGRLGVLPALIFFALTTSPDFTHYSTEVMPLWLLAAAAYAAAGGILVSPRGRLWLVAVLLGSVPWAKPQAAPLAVALWALVAWQEKSAGRSATILPLIVGPLLPALGCVGAVTLAGQGEHLMVPYVLRNLNYVREAPLAWSERAMLQWHNALLDGYLGLWVAGATGFCLLALFGWRRASSSQRRAVIAATALLAVGLWVVVAPSRPSMHHLLLITVPLTWLTGAMIALHGARLAATETFQRHALFAGVFLGLCALPSIGWRVRTGDSFAGIHTGAVSPAHRQLAALVRRFTGPDESLAIWGWRCSLYVEAARRQATREAHTEAQIYANPYQRYYLRRYLEDFQRSDPPVFVDAVGPGNFAFTDRARAHEAFPPLRAWVQAHYTLIGEVDGTRLYLRNDRLASAALARPPAP